jgi:hypothetical protein
MKCLHSGELQGKKIAGRWYVTEEDLKEYLKTNKSASDRQHERIGRLMMMERMEEEGEYRDEIRDLWQRLMRFSVDEDTERGVFYRSCLDMDGELPFGD